MREKEKKAEGKYQELICGHSSKGSWEAMERMKLVMEISNTDKHPKKCNLQKSSRQSGRGAVRIHKPHVSANLWQPPAPLPVTPMQHPCLQGTVLMGSETSTNTKCLPAKRKAQHPRLSTAPGCAAVTCCSHPCARFHTLMRASEDWICLDWDRWCWQNNTRV